jgi:hypothetical protein
MVIFSVSLVMSSSSINRLSRSNACLRCVSFMDDNLREIWEEQEFKRILQKFGIPYNLVSIYYIFFNSNGLLITRN